MHSFDHNSVVCCVKFSLDGRFLAAGCNRVTYIYDVSSGNKIWYIQSTIVLISHLLPLACFKMNQVLKKAIFTFDPFALVQMVVSLLQVQKINRSE